MGLREKVALFVVVVFFIQIAFNECAAKTFKKSYLKPYKNNGRKFKNNRMGNTMASPTPPMETMKNTKDLKLYRNKSKSRRPMNSNTWPTTKRLDVPEMEYPYVPPASPMQLEDTKFSKNTNPFMSKNKEIESASPTPKKSYTKLQKDERMRRKYSGKPNIDNAKRLKEKYKLEEDEPTVNIPKPKKAFNKLDKEERLNRKYGNKKVVKTQNVQSGNECFSEYVTSYEPYCYKKVGTFPEVEYPLAPVETWKPQYWRTLPYTEKDMQDALIYAKPIKQCSEQLDISNVMTNTSRWPPIPYQINNVTTECIFPDNNMMMIDNTTTFVTNNENFTTASPISQSNTSRTTLTPSFVKTENNVFNLNRPDSRETNFDPITLDTITKNNNSFMSIQDILTDTSEQPFYSEILHTSRMLAMPPLDEISALTVTPASLENLESAIPSTITEGTIPITDLPATENIIPHTLAVIEDPALQIPSKESTLMDKDLLATIDESPISTISPIFVENPTQATLTTIAKNSILETPVRGSVNESHISTNAEAIDENTISEMPISIIESKMPTTVPEKFDLENAPWTPKTTMPTARAEEDTLIAAVPATMDENSDSVTENFISGIPIRITEGSIPITAPPVFTESTMPTASAKDNISPTEESTSLDGSSRMLANEDTIPLESLPAVTNEKLKVTEKPVSEVPAYITEGETPATGLPAVVDEGPVSTIALAVTKNPVAAVPASITGGATPTTGLPAIVDESPVSSIAPAVTDNPASVVPAFITDGTTPTTGLPAVVDESPVSTIAPAVTEDPAWVVPDFITEGAIPTTGLPATLDESPISTIAPAVTENPASAGPASITKGESPTTGLPATSDESPVSIIAPAVTENPAWVVPASIAESVSPTTGLPATLDESPVSTIAPAVTENPASVEPASITEDVTSTIGLPGIVDENPVSTISPAVSDSPALVVPASVTEGIIPTTELPAIVNESPASPITPADTENPTLAVPIDVIENGLPVAGVPANENESLAPTVVPNIIENPILAMPTDVTKDSKPITATPEREDKNPASTVLSTVMENRTSESLPAFTKNITPTTLSTVVNESPAPTRIPEVIEDPISEVLVSITEEINLMTELLVIDQSSLLPDIPLTENLTPNLPITSASLVVDKSPISTVTPHVIENPTSTVSPSISEDTIPITEVPTNINENPLLPISPAASGGISSTNESPTTIDVPIGKSPVTENLTSKGSAPITDLPKTIDEIPLPTTVPAVTQNPTSVVQGPTESTIPNKAKSEATDVSSMSTDTPTTFENLSSAMSVTTNEATTSATTAFLDESSVTPNTASNLIESPTSEMLASNAEDSIVFNSQPTDTNENSLSNIAPATEDETSTARLPTTLDERPVSSITPTNKNPTSALPTAIPKDSIPITSVPTSLDESPIESKAPVTSTNSPSDFITDISGSPFSETSSTQSESSSTNAGREKTCRIHENRP